MAELSATATPLRAAERSRPAERRPIGRLNFFPPTPTTKPGTRHIDGCPCRKITGIGKAHVKLAKSQNLASRSVSSLRSVKYKYAACGGGWDFKVSGGARGVPLPEYRQFLADDATRRLKPAAA